MMMTAKTDAGNESARAAFEAWLNPGGHAGNVSPWVEPGRYEKDTHQLAWLAWQRWEDALRQTWKMVDPLKPAGQPGSYWRGQDAGITAALNTLRANLKSPNYCLNGGSRGTGQGTSNFVVFPGEENMLTILERNGQPVR